MGRSRTPSYVCLPRPLLTQPPIHHRHMPDDNGYVTAFEFDIACALLGAARLGSPCGATHRASHRAGSENRQTIFQKP